LNRVVLAFLFLFSLSAVSQSNYAVLGGTILDPQGRPFPTATLILNAVDTRAVRQATTNQSGIFQISGLQPGDYELSVQAAGFASISQQLRLEVSQQLTLNLKLKVAVEKNVVEVAGQAPVLHSNDAAVGEVVEPVSIKELPLNGRMLIDLVLTVPGAHESHGAQTGNMNPLYWRPGQRSAVSIGGNRPNANYFLLDGTTNTDPTFNTLNLSPSPDAVQEFKVQTGSYSAEMGGAGGGQINIVTRSGTSQFHGTAYEFLRNGGLDAHSFNSMGNNHLVQNNYGASFGGPIAHKTFFFLNYEGFRHVMAETMTDTLPTAAEVMGDFSQSGKNIYDPNSSQPNPAFDPSKPVTPTNPQFIRSQFQDGGVNNVIPTDRIKSRSSGIPDEVCPDAECRHDDGHGDHAVWERYDGRADGGWGGNRLQ
jgi:Carboxypeptidase regulatory-like domain